ncbi:class I SAM-dependent DNA methyltransferase [Sulfurimonas autotrophica]|uniref:Methyltransferase type 12 n=1 Tax=Sulfurimonas autotrophica (strain ATCC BAA-671 / DSM 16294 / JCM 11897 / OK10) TaxID=563040 RepID=E0URJ7_SULAO|nr:class I SAM-dependent methyltransferase [Sulfurimonas autotrophica]ADN08941.1 Methyltransferase type 12 [Sulfurimonas autotrophica DSM 16294]
MQDHFKDKAQNWDSGDIRVNGAKIIADAIEKEIQLSKDMEILDFGVGTGLLGFSVAPKVKQVYGIDTSAKMLEKLEEKNTPELQIKAYHQDIIKEPLQQQFDGLISSMTLHHVEDLDAFFKTIYNNIKTNGFIAIADLESEDGSFHSDNTGVHHFGFDAQTLCEIVQKHGFDDIKIQNINTINKPRKDFGVFLLTAKKC